MLCAEIMNGWSYNSTSPSAVMVYTGAALPLPFFFSVVSLFLHSAVLFLSLFFCVHIPVSFSHTRKKQKRYKDINMYEETDIMHR